MKGAISHEEAISSNLYFVNRDYVQSMLSTVFSEVRVNARNWKFANGVLPRRPKQQKQDVEPYTEHIWRICTEERWGCVKKMK